MHHYRVNEVRMRIGEEANHLPGHISKKLSIPVAWIESYDIRRESVDARDKSDIRMVYTVDFYTKKPLRRKHRNLQEVGDERPQEPVPGDEPLTGRPLIVGFGPCGIFAALHLARRGYRPIVIERGKPMADRVADVERFREEGVLNPESNVLFGEGGAGTFSDGKLTSGIKSDYIRDVLETFVEAGANPRILYQHRPHIGTDVLRHVIVKIREEIIRWGGEIRFETKLDSLLLSNTPATAGVFESNATADSGVSSSAADLNSCREFGISEDDILSGAAVNAAAIGCSTANTDIALEEKKYRITGAIVETRDGHKETIHTNAIILAIGHSARDTFRMIRDTGLPMEQKPLSIGVRMEHPQEIIDRAQYGDERRLPPADYKVSYRASNGRGVYSFCMCPGGEVIVCSTKEEELCVNGMSNSARDSGTANSGVLCDVRTSDFGSEDVLAGIAFQEKYERIAYQMGLREHGRIFAAPRCTMAEFLGGTGDSHYVTDSLPDFAVDAIREAVPHFARRIHGYDMPDAIIKAVETRSSSPLRILRDETGQSAVRGLYPAGEGAGYAGGITSAACDGIRMANHLIEKFAPPENE